MARTTTSSNVGKGKITAVQIAFIVARYLSDNKFEATSAAFRSDASHLLSRSRDKEVPKGLLSLDDILDEYIRLKEQKVGVDQEKTKMDLLLQRIQDALHLYHHSSASASASVPTFPGSVMSVPVTLSEPSIISAKSQNQSFFSTPTTINSTSKTKRKPSSKTAPPPPKKPRSQNSGNKALQAMNSNAEERSSDQSTIQPAALHGSSVAKNLFKHTPAPRVKSTSPKTPQNNLHSNSDESDTPMDAAFLANTSIHNFPQPQQMSASKSFVLSSKALGIDHSMERSHCLSVSPPPVRSSPSNNTRKNHVKGRLNFNSSKTSPQTLFTSTSMDEALPDPMFDLDLPDFDVDFSFSQLLVDLEFPCEEKTTTCRKTSNYPPPHIIIPWSKPGTTRVSETTKTLSSDLPNITKVVTEEDENISGEDQCNSSGAEEELQV